VAHVRLHDIAAEPKYPLRAARDRAEWPRSNVLVAGVGAFQRLIETTLVQLVRRKPERESGIGARKATMHIPMRHGTLEPLVDVDIGGAEEVVHHHVTGRVNLVHGLLQSSDCK
jgi:hypothetical protein